MLCVKIERSDDPEYGYYQPLEQNTIELHGEMTDARAGLVVTATVVSMTEEEFEALPSD